MKQPIDSDSDLSKTSPTSANPFWVKLFENKYLYYLIIPILFAINCWQAPLYYSNQNQYFLHGFAEAKIGYLEEDWLAKCADPTPVFTTLVSWTKLHLAEAVFYLDYAIIQGLYILTLVAIARTIIALLSMRLLVAEGREKDQRTRLFLVVVCLFAIHAALWRFFGYRWLGNDYLWFFQSGVAGQYILGAMFQPSVFGVFLLIAISCYLRERFILASIWIALGCYLHTTYLLPGALLTLGFQFGFVLEKRYGKAIQLGLLTLILVLPIVYYSWQEFSPTDLETFRSAQTILSQDRIPHHCRVDRWFEWIAACQLVMISLAIMLLPIRRGRNALAASLFLAACLTIFQALSGNTTLALLFPWRLTAILMPISTTVLVTFLIMKMPRWVESSLIRTALLIFFIGTIIGGLVIGIGRYGFFVNNAEDELMAFVRDHRQANQIYLLPVKMPDLSKNPRGSLSSDFKPLIEKQQSSQIIQIDLQRFRLHTGTPIYIDFKSIPYTDQDVLEWKRRLKQTEEIYKQLREILHSPKDHQAKLTALIQELQQAKITHIVLPIQPNGANETISELPEVYRDRYYQVLSIPQLGR